MKMNQVELLKSQKKTYLLPKNNSSDNEILLQSLSKINNFVKKIKNKVEFNNKSENNIIINDVIIYMIKNHFYN